MKAIALKNFRKFIDFPQIDLGSITILVGGNNSGKSTLVKAMLLMRDFLKLRVEQSHKNGSSALIPTFKFDTTHVNIGNFKRAFCKHSEKGEDSITLTLGMEEFLFIISIRGNREKETIHQVSSLRIDDAKRNITFVFDFSKGEMSAIFGTSEQDKLNNQEYVMLQRELLNLKNELDSCKDLERIAELKTTILQYESRKAILVSYSILQEKSVTIDRPVFPDDNNIGYLMLPELVNGFLHYTELKTTGDKRTNEYKKEEENKALIRSKASVIVESINRMITVIFSKEIEYIYAHSVSQQALYSIKDANDYVAETIHDFYISKITEGDEEFAFVQKWMNAFEIGTNVSVYPILGEAYRVTISDFEGHEEELADKGMGSIQLMVLLLRLATLMRKFKGQSLTVLLEEPEQNLHPAFQSLLAELLHEVYLNYGFQFVVETHSEYLVRNTQVIVAKDYGLEYKLGNNPFCVFYLDGVVGAYNLSYLSNGKFDRDFGSGFFDVADNAALDLFNLEN